MILPCPRCPVTITITVSAEDPDASLSDLWEHLYRHAENHAERNRLFIHAQEAAR